MEEEKFFVNAMDVQLSEMNFEQSTNFVSLKWDNSMDQTTQFESAYSSIASSPSAAAVAGPADSLVIRELIGRLGSIGNNNSTNTSCYSTPLNSPPKINLSLIDQQIGGNLPIPANTLAPFHTDPGFAERAAKNSCFGSQNFSGLSLPHISAPEGSKLSRVSSSQSFRTSSQIEQGNAREESSVSDQITNEANVRKRKTAPRGKPRDKDLKVSEHEDSDAKRSKTSESTGTEKEAAAKAKTEQKQSKDNAKPPEPPKDYIHVRARRGQATDSHSLAERVRREKISERMKFLQDLVPGCNKVTGKAVMLDEIINYVQSLQRQVEFLSMKLATVNPRLDFNMEALLLKDMHQAHDSLPQTGYQMDSTVSAFPFIHQAHAGPTIQNGANGSETNGSANPLAASHGRSWSMQLASMDIFGDAAPQLSGIWEDDLQTVVQMGFGQNQDLAFSSQSFHGSLPTARMKVEL